MEEFDADRYVLSAAPALGIALTPHEREQVAEHMRRIDALAQLLLQHELTHLDEIAPRFEP